jgi:hypothetical protein
VLRGTAHDWAAHFLAALLRVHGDAELGAARRPA